MKIRDQWGAARAICVVVMFWGALYAAVSLVQLYFALRPLWSHS